MAHWVISPEDLRRLSPPMDNVTEARPKESQEEELSDLQRRKEKLLSPSPSRERSKPNTEAYDFCWGHPNALMSPEDALSFIMGLRVASET